MSSSLRRMLSLLLTIIILVQICPSTVHADNGFIIIKEGKLEEKKIEQEFIYQTYLEPEYIRQHITYEDEIYQYEIPEQYLCEATLYEIKITPDTISHLVEILPPQFNDYDIDWAGVIAKFAVGTSIIIAVGVVHHFTKGISDFFIMATPASVAKDAFIGGAIGAALDVSIHELMADGKLPDRAIYKFALEGFADGYMWGAITSVLKVAVKNAKRLRAFKKATGGELTIKLSGEVLDKAGNTVGKAYYDASKVWHLVDEVNNTTTIFDSAGKELLSQAGTKLPANQILKLGEEAASHICRTDALGQIYQVDNALKPNITYQLGEYVYQTDSKGRIVKVVFDHLVMKPEGQHRLVIANTLKEIGKGYEKLNDDRGHLIGDLFSGDNTLANIVPQSQNVNRRYVKEIEVVWKNAILKGQNVSGSIQLSYKGGSFRPNEFTYSYDAGSGLVEAVILNK